MLRAENKGNGQFCHPMVIPGSALDTHANWIGAFYARFLRGMLVIARSPKTLLSSTLVSWWSQRSCIIKSLCIKGALYIIQILCRWYTFWSYPAGLTIAEPPGLQKLKYRRVYSHHFHNTIAESIQTTTNSIQCPFKECRSSGAKRVPTRFVISVSILPSSNFVDCHKPPHRWPKNLRKPL